MTVQVRPNVVDQIVAANRTDRMLEVLAADGRPFLRIGPGGVEGDAASVDFSRTSSPSGESSLARSASTTPDWRRLSTDPSWGWFEHRLHPTATPSPSVNTRWQVPFRLGGDAVVVRGLTDVTPPRGSYTVRLDPRSEHAGRFSVISGAVPALTVSTAGSRLTVLGAANEPMIRAGARRVEVNDASPTWSPTRESRGEPAGGPVGPSEPARWRSVPAGAVFTWLDKRAAPPRGVPKNPQREQSVRTWRIPVLLEGGPRSAIGGDVRWTPSPSANADDGGSGPSPALMSAAVVAGVATTVLVVRALARRQRAA